MITTLSGNQIKVLREWGGTVISLGYDGALLQQPNKARDREKKIHRERNSFAYPIHKFTKKILQ